MTSFDTSQFEILSENVVYKRYLTVKDRLVKFPDGREIKWDVTGHDVPEQPAYSVVFPFFTKDRTVTLVREYAQGDQNVKAHRIYDRKKSSSPQACAASELSEEARLAGGEWIPLLPEGHRGISELKWCTNRFTPFLVIDPIRDTDPGERDAEEFIKITPHVPLTQLKELILKGELMLPSVQTTMMAIEQLKQRGLIEAW